MKATNFRSIEYLTGSECLAAIQPNKLSFASTFQSKFTVEHWSLDIEYWDLDSQGKGIAIYRCVARGHVFRMLIFSDNLEEFEREDRSIADRWDGLSFLVEGPLDNDRIGQLRYQSSKGGRDWRVDSDVFCWSKVNRSSRLFDEVVSALSKKTQPKLQKLDEVGYLFRNSGVIANGAQGTKPFHEFRNDHHPGHPLGEPFHAQLLSLYIWREFSIDLVEFLASQIDPVNSTRLSPEARELIGVGNSSSLGLVLFANNNPHLLHLWRMRTEQALQRVLSGNITQSLRAKIKIAGLQKLKQSEYGEGSDEYLEFQNFLETLTNSKKIEEGIVFWQRAVRELSAQSLELLVSTLLEDEESNELKSYTFCSSINICELDKTIRQLTVKQLLGQVETEIRRLLECQVGFEDDKRVVYYRSMQNREPRIALRNQMSDWLGVSVIPDYLEYLRISQQKLLKASKNLRISALFTLHIDLWWTAFHLQLRKQYALGVFGFDLQNQAVDASVIIRLCMSLIGLERLRSSETRQDVTGILFRGAPRMRPTDAVQPVVKEEPHGYISLYNTKYVCVERQQFAKVLKRALKRLSRSVTISWVGTELLMQMADQRGAFTKGLFQSIFDVEERRTEIKLTKSFNDRVYAVMEKGFSNVNPNINCSQQNFAIDVFNEVWQKLNAIADAELVPPLQVAASTNT